MSTDTTVPPLDQSALPAPRRTRSRRGLAAALRRGWARLTSMRTALVLLFLLAVAAVPGSVLPQRGANPLRVDAYFVDHPTLAPVLDRLWLFDVYASPWFASVYILLFVSLVGCLVPRLRHHVAELRREPPRTPRRLDRLPASGALHTDLPPDEAAAAAAGLLRRRRWRTVVRREEAGGTEAGGAPGGVRVPEAWTVAAERGYLRETGNLVFHVSLLVLLVGIAMGGLGSWRGTVLVLEGETACTTAGRFDQFTAGPLVGADDVPALCVTLDDFRATYFPTGMPEDFVADVTYREDATAAAAAGSEEFALRVNNPLRLDATRAYLLNHGFAPVITVTDPTGAVFERIRAPFLPQDARFTSEGVFKLPDAAPAQYGFEGFFLPTRPESGPPIVSASPEPRSPALTLLAYSGDLGLDSGVPQSVYSLDAARIEAGDLTSIATATLAPGETWQLPDGGSVRFEGYDEWVTIQVTEDPGQLLVLGAAATMILGLLASLLIRRRRVWLRVTEGGAVAVGGLPRTDREQFRREFGTLVDELERILVEGRRT